MCAHMNVMSINGIVSQYSMTIIRQLRGDTPINSVSRLKQYIESGLCQRLLNTLNQFLQTKGGVKSLYSVDLVSWFIYEVMTLQLSSECNSLTHYHCIRQNVTENYLSFVPNNVVRAITQISNLSETDNYPGLIPTSSLSNSLSAM